ncbi:MAG: 2-oxoisovalerate dehydrogenase component alpha subunit [Chloroflexia bacterium]|jgi:2-oxoisovalerate dehydrogenase E1 component alpha subunit|nr:2-oxoisovalerate dehydrogenase component alpha subunit [Chloroflexia bacterium]
MATSTKSKVDSNGRRSKSSATKSQHEALGLGKEQLLDMWYYMLLARSLDERMWLLNRQGKAPFVISCQGHEAIQIGVSFALERGKDWFLPYYRDLGVCLALGVTPRETMLQHFAKRDDPSSGGRQMPGHYGYKKYKIVTGSSPVATQFCHAVGVALASKLKGSDEVTVVSGGEGATSKGDWHEAMNLAGIHDLPVIFLIENNQYAISVPVPKQVAGGSVAARGVGYGMPGVEVDGTDVLAVYEVAREAARRARAGEGPTLIEAKTYRLTAHSSDDNDRTYRGREEIEIWRAKEPIPKFRQYLLDSGVATEEELGQIKQRIDGEVNDATDWAETQPVPSADDTLKHVFASPEEKAQWR